jgi:hypothetical protein
MSDKKLLIKFDSNYADEFDVEGFTIMNESEWEKHKADVTAFFKKRDETVAPNRWGHRDGVEVYFGTNEQMIYETLDCYLRSFTATEVSDEEIAVLQKHFSRGGGVRFGMLCMLEDLEED